MTLLLASPLDRLPVHTPNDSKAYLDRLMIVDDPVIGEVAVRWRPPSPRNLERWSWKCSNCGPTRHVQCLHTFAAAVHLAEDLLGLTPTPNPNGSPT